MDVGKITTENQFIWGPGPLGSPLFGLYLPIKNCFLITYHDLGIISKLRYILSSKCNLVLITISGSPLWRPTMIDNTVSLEWTIADQTKIDFRYDIKNPVPIDGSITGIAQKKSITTDHWLISLQEFAQKSLQLLIRSDEFKSIPAGVIAVKFHEFFTVGLDFIDPQSFPVMDYHHDDLGQRIKGSLIERMSTIEAIIANALRDYEGMIYWAKDKSDLDDVWERFQKLLIKNLGQ